MSGLRNFHEGEARLQAESGVDTEAFDALVDPIFRPELSDAEARFVNERTFSVAATVDTDGRPWISPLVGPSGVLFQVLDETTVRITSDPAPGDPLHENVDATNQLGVLYFDPGRRNRAKSIGRATRDGNVLTYAMHRNFRLCNKYIFKRTHAPATDEVPPSSVAERRDALDAADREQLTATDTVFLGSVHVDHGVDPTHRGGPPGFVTVLDDTTITLPDYTGNGMFQTLGNLVLDDHVALTTIDFATGRTLHLSGRGVVVASPPSDEYSARTLRIAIDDVRVSNPAIGAWTDIEAFELRPGLINPKTPFL